MEQQLTDRLETSPKEGFWRGAHLAKVLRSRTQCLLIPTVFITYGALHGLGVFVFPCPVHLAFARKCPGCGMTKAMEAGLHGRWLEMVEHNPFAPVFAILFAVLAVVGLLPLRWRMKLADAVEWFERRIPLVAGFGVLFILWGVFRSGGLLGLSDGV